MKKIISIVLIAMMMFFMFSFSAFAEVSPTAEPKPDAPSGPSTSPQTGDSIVYFGVAALFMAAVAGIVATKKIKE